MDSSLVIIVGLFGLLVGSFLNVVIARLPLKDPADRSVGGRSRCPHCRHEIAWYDNIPLLSYVVLRGRCRGCHERISWRYPVVEALNAGLWAAVAYAADDYWVLAIGIVFMSQLVVITFIDLAHHIIPNKITIPGTLVGLAMGIAAEPSRWLELVLATIAAGGFLLITAIVYPAGMGMGDVKMAALMGAYLGAAVAIGMFAGFVAGAIVGIAIMVRHGAAARKQGVPFGPFLALGSVFAWFWGPELLDLYLSTFE